LLLETLPAGKVRGRDRRVNGKEGLEIAGELMQRGKAKTPPGESGVLCRGEA
jgi:hypothetical protein